MQMGLYSTVVEQTVYSLPVNDLLGNRCQPISLLKKKSHNTPNKNPATKQTSLSNLLQLRFVQRQRDGGCCVAAVSSRKQLFGAGAGKFALKPEAVG